MDPVSDNQQALAPEGSEPAAEEAPQTAQAVVEQPQAAEEAPQNAQAVVEQPQAAEEAPQTAQAVVEQTADADPPVVEQATKAADMEIDTRDGGRQDTADTSAQDPPLRNVAGLDGVTHFTTEGASASFRQTLSTIRTEGRVDKSVRQRYKAYLQTTVYRDGEERAEFSPLFTPKQMEQEVKNFQPAPILIDHEEHKPSIGTLERLWIEPFEGNPTLCGTLYFHMENEESRAVVNWLNTKGSVDLSLGCDQAYDLSWNKLRTMIREISVVTLGDHYGAFVRTNGSALKINSPGSLRLPVACYIELGTTTYHTMGSNEMTTETAAPASPASPASSASPAAPAPTTAPAASEQPNVAELLKDAMNVFMQGAELVNEGKRVWPAKVPDQAKAFMDMHEQARSDPSRLADTAFLEQYAQKREIADAMLAAVSSMAPPQPEKRQRADSVAPSTLEMEIEKRRRQSVQERLREAPMQWKDKTNALVPAPNESLPYEVPANFEEWKRYVLSNQEYEPKLVRFANAQDAKKHMDDMFRAKQAESGRFTEIRVQSAASDVPQVSVRDVLLKYGNIGSK